MGERLHADVLPGGHNAPQPMSVCLRPPVTSILSWLAGPALSPASHSPQAELSNSFNTPTDPKINIKIVWFFTEDIKLPPLIHVLYLLHTQCTQFYRALANALKPPDLLLSFHTTSSTSHSSPSLPSHPLQPVPFLPLIQSLLPFQSAAPLSPRHMQRQP